MRRNYMSSKRERVTHNQQTYMVTTNTWERRGLFRNECWARLLLDTLYHYRGSAYLLDEFVIMPDHIHVLVSPTTSLEKAVQFIKGGFSYRAKKELGFGGEIWETSFHDWRVRDWEEYCHYRDYIHLNPVKARLSTEAAFYSHSSAAGRFPLAPCPQRLKPTIQAI